MTLSKITLRNFQCHRTLSLDLNPGVTTIVGPSDSGKSAILRALRWLATNRPAGDTFLHKGKKVVSIRLEADGRPLTRRKGNGINEYRVNGLALRAFGSQVPREVLEVLRLGEINFQGQYDSPFWLASSAAEVSRQLNQIVNLDLIDTTSANLASKYRKAQAEIRVFEDRLSTAKARTTNLAFALQANETLKGVEKLAEDLQSLASRVEVLSALVTEAKTLATQQARMRAAANKGRAVLALGRQWEGLKGQCCRLSSLSMDGLQLQSTIGRGVPDIQPLESAFDVWQGREAEADKLERLISQARELEEVECQSTEALRDAQKELSRQKVCPLCGQKMSWPSSSPTST